MLFSAHETRLVTVAEDQTLRLWDCTRQGSTAVPRNPSLPIEAITLSPDGRTAVSSGGGQAVLWDVQRATERSALAGKGTWVQSVAYSNDGRLICVAARSDRFRIFDARTGTCLIALGSESDGASAAFSPDGRMLATSSGDEEIISLWNAAAYCSANGIARIIRRLPWWSGTRPVAVLSGAEKHSSPIFSPDGRLLAAPFYASIAIWDLGADNQRVLLQGHRDRVHCVAFSVDSRSLASGSGERYPGETGYGWGSYDNSVRLWRVPDGVELKQFDGHRDLVTCVAFSPDGGMIVSGSRDGTVCIWDVASGRNLVRLSAVGAPVRQVGFDVTGNEFFAAALHGYMRWRAGTWREVEKIMSDVLETVILPGSHDTPCLAYPEPLDLLERCTLDWSVILGARSNHLTVLRLTRFDR